MRILILLIISAFILPDIACAATEYATFESFYKESSKVGWVLSAALAVVFGAVIFFTGGTASPIVVGIGSWIGGMMGYSGIVATNVGLALLGGGSIASGGFGIVGGTALLAAALTFGTDIVIDYTVVKTVSEYKYSNLSENSRGMLTLPLPINNTGPDEFKYAVKKLDDIDNSLSISSSGNQKIIKQTIVDLENITKTSKVDESSKNSSLLALLYFASNDYVSAKKYASLAIQSARESGIKRTLPAFIYATSTLYDETFDFELITNNFFSYSVLAEPKNPLIPLLFSIYLDRMQLRFNDGYLNAADFDTILNVMKSPALKNKQALHYAILMPRYFLQLKLEQQKIASLSSSDNKDIKNSEKTLSNVVYALKQYDILVERSKVLMKSFSGLDLKAEDRIKESEFNTLLESYNQDKERLILLVDELKDYQRSFSSSSIESKYQMVFIYIAFAVFFAFGIAIMVRRYMLNR